MQRWCCVLSTPACFQQSLHSVKLIASAIRWVKNAQTRTGGGGQLAKNDDAGPLVTTVVLPLKYKNQGNHRYILRERERERDIQSFRSQVYHRLVHVLVHHIMQYVCVGGWVGATVNVDLPFPFCTPPGILVLMCVLSHSL